MQHAKHLNNHQGLSEFFFNMTSCYCPAGGFGLFLKATTTKRNSGDDSKGGSEMYSTVVVVVVVVRKYK